MKITKRSVAFDAQSKLVVIKLADNQKKITRKKLTEVSELAVGGRYTISVSEMDALAKLHGLTHQRGAKGIEAALIS